MHLVCVLPVCIHVYIKYAYIDCLEPLGPDHVVAADPCQNPAAQGWPGPGLVLGGSWDFITTLLTGVAILLRSCLDVG